MWGLVQSGEIGLGGVEWIQLAQDRGPVVGDEPAGSGAMEWVLSSSPSSLSSLLFVDDKLATDVST
jgi:hypothetical protein